jgi:glutamate-5-semialdehyde dehydrogenase
MVTIEQAAAGALAAKQMLGISRSVKDAALDRIAAGLSAAAGRIFEANAMDTAAARQAGLPAPTLARLAYGQKKLAESIAMIEALKGLPDPAGRLQEARQLDTDLVLRRVSCPIGLIALIFESRPDALVQMAALAAKSGNAIIVKGGREAEHSNRVLADVVSTAGIEAGLPAGWLGHIETRDEVARLLEMDQYVDLVIPRGSKEFVRHIMEHSRIPVLGHSDGVCHVYVHADADIAVAARIAVDSKIQYPAACNAAEVLLLDAAITTADTMQILEALESAGVALEFCPRTWALAGHGYGAGPGMGDRSLPSNPDCSIPLDISPDIPADIPAANSPHSSIPHSSIPHSSIPADIPAANSPHSSIPAAGPIAAPSTRSLKNDGDWAVEYLDMRMAVRIVDSLEAAIAHINQYGSGHTDAIVTRSAAAAARFMAQVDSASVYHNASTRFADGYRYGLGAEVGISTGKLHARGPMGLDGLMTYKWLLSGTGQLVADYASGRRHFQHIDLDIDMDTETAAAPPTAPSTSREPSPPLAPQATQPTSREASPPTAPSTSREPSPPLAPQATQPTSREASPPTSGRPSPQSGKEAIHGC